HPTQRPDEPTGPHEALHARLISPGSSGTATFHDHLHGKESGMVARDHHGHHPNGHTAYDQPRSAEATGTDPDHHAAHETAMGHGGHEHHEHASGGHGQEGKHHAGHEAHGGQE